MFAGSCGRHRRPRWGSCRLRQAGSSQGWPGAAREPPAADAALADGTVNFGRVPGEKGTWNVPYITNMAMRVVRSGWPAAARDRHGQAAAAAARRRRRPVRAVAAVADRGGSKSEPWMPWMPWSAAVYDYNSANESKCDPEGYCLPPGGPRMMATPYPMEIIQLPEHKRIVMIFEGATHIWREIYMDGRAFPEATRSTPPTSATRSAAGKATRSSSRTRGSTRTAGSTTSATRTPT